MASKKINLLAILTLLTALLLGCASDDGHPQKMKPLQIGLLPVEDIMPLLVAEKNGYFEAEGVPVDLVTFQSAAEQSNTMQAGSLNGMVTDIIVATMMKDAGLDLKITSLTLGATPQEGRFALLAAPQSGIHQPQDLKGKSIGISHNSIIEYVTDGLLKDSGVDPATVKKTSIPKIPLRMEMLFSSQVDAITVPDPMVTFAEFKGCKVIAQDTQRNLSQAVMIFDQETLDKQPQAVAAFYRAYAKAVQDLNDHPEQYKQLMVERVNIPAPIAEDYPLQHYPAPQLPAEQDVNNVLQWMQQKQLLKQKFQYADLVQKP